MVSEIEAAWAAGIMEGEGCFSIFKRQTSTENHKAIHIQCTMTDQDVILKLKNIFNVGTLHEHKHYGQRCDGQPYKPAWRWSVQNHAGIRYVIDRILPYLGERRSAKAIEILEYIKGAKGWKKLDEC